MSGSSKEFDPGQLAEDRRRQALNNEVNKRIRASSGTGAVKVDLTARDEERPTLNTRPRFMASPFTPQKTAAQRIAEDAARIEAARALAGVRKLDGENSAATKAEIEQVPGRPPKREKAPKVDKPKADKPAKAAKQVAAPQGAQSPIVEVVSPEEREARIAAYCESLRQGAGKDEKEDKLVAYTYDLPGIDKQFTAKSKPSEVAPKMVDLARAGSRVVRLETGVILTLIHTRRITDPVTGHVTAQDFSVGRRYFPDALKANDAGAKALAEGIPRSKQCPCCKGMGRLHDNRTTSKVCHMCVTECKKCSGDDCTKCRGEGSYGRGNVPDAPLKVDAIHVGSEIHRTLPCRVTLPSGETGIVDRGVLGLDRPLSAQPVIPSRKAGAITTGGKPASGAWQSRAKTTQVTFSGG